MSENRPPRDTPEGVIPGDTSLEGTSTALKRIPLMTTVSKEYEYFSEFIAEFGQHIYPQGMFVPSPRPKPKGARLKLDIKTRDGFQILDAICEVVRCDEALPGTLSGMWVAFTRITDGSRELIGRIVNERDRPGEAARAAATDTSPGATDTSPGATDTSPGTTDTSPGPTDTSPGVTDTSPGSTDSSPGNVPEASQGSAATNKGGR